MKIDALILAGGLGQRMGRIEKGLVQFQNKSLIEHCLDQLSLQQIEFNHIFLNVNRQLEDYARYNLQLIQDIRSDLKGPLAGIESGISHSFADYLFVISCDMPKIPQSSCSEFIQHLQENTLKNCVCFKKNQGREPFPFLVRNHESVKHILDIYLHENNLRLQQWQSQIGCIELDSSFQFSNINTLDDLA